MASTLINFHAIAVDNFIRADKGIMEVWDHSIVFSGNLLHPNLLHNNIKILYTFNGLAITVIFPETSLSIVLPI